MRGINELNDTRTFVASSQKEDLVPWFYECVVHTCVHNKMYNTSAKVFMCKMREHMAKQIESAHCT